MSETTNTPKPASDVASLPAKLLPCPFCGNEVQDDEGCFRVGINPQRYTVRCGNPSCFAHDPAGGSRNATITAWNRRALASPAGEGGLAKNRGERLIDRLSMHARDCVKAADMDTDMVLSKAQIDAMADDMAEAGLVLGGLMPDGDIPAQARAWLRVCELLDELDPLWNAGQATGEVCAITAIRRLATPEQPEHGYDERIEKLQRALNYWLPTTAQVPDQFGERVREDATLLMGFTGPGMDEPCFHDLASEQPGSAVQGECDHRWVTDGIGPTRCSRCSKQTTPPPAPTGDKQ